MNAERYRPRSWDEVVGQPVEEIRALVDGANTPDFLFYGPPGTGKTTVAYLISATIQGSLDELMEFNASNDRGIDVVREQIAPKVHQTTLSGAPRVIFLDEMDSMTLDAQEALRQPMEQSDATFILAGNNEEGIHGALKSRCYDYEFGPVPESAVKERIRQLAERDGLDLSDQQVRSIASFANGDMRNAIQRYTQYAHGAYTDEDDAAPAPDGSTFERSAREYLGED